MTGANYSSFGCSSSRRKSGVVIFKVPQEDDEKSSNWRKSIIRVATKDRVVDKALRQRIIKKNIFVCEKHYSEDQLKRCMYKIISSLILNKSMKISCNSGRQASYKFRKSLPPLLFSSLQQLCKKMSVNSIKT